MPGRFVVAALSLRVGSFRLGVAIELVAGSHSVDDYVHASVAGDFRRRGSAAAS